MIRRIIGKTATTIRGAAAWAVCLIAALFAAMSPASAQAQETADDAEVRLKVKAYEGYTRFVDQYGDTCRMTYIRNITVYPPMKFRNKKEEQFYWRTVRDVKLTLPYAKLIAETLVETYEYIETFPTKKEREEYLKRMEKSLCETYEYIQTIPDKKERERHLKRLERDIFNQYKPVVKKMTKGQGKVMLKLINRETDQTSYNIVKAFLGSFRAGFWQTFGRFFGMNMKAGFNPAKNREDAIIDRVATLIEQGAL